MKEIQFIISIGQKLEVLYGSLEAEFKIELKFQAVHEIQVDFEYT